MAGAPETAAVSARSVYTIQPHVTSGKATKGSVHARLSVTCHPRFWPNDRDLLRATAVTRGWERIPK